MPASKASSPFLKKRSKKLLSLAVAALSGEARDSIDKSFLLLFFKKEGFLLLSCITFLLSVQPAAAQTATNCVDVTVGHAQSYDCINQQLGAVAAQQHRAASSSADAPYSATSPSNVTGQFNESATRNRLGSNFGHSVTPERPAYNPPANPIPR